MYIKRHKYQIATDVNISMFEVSWRPSSLNIANGIQIFSSILFELQELCICNILILSETMSPVKMQEQLLLVIKKKL